jgi:hypothetical protein
MLHPDIAPAERDGFRAILLGVLENRIPLMRAAAVL